MKFRFVAGAARIHCAALVFAVVGATACGDDLTGDVGPSDEYQARCAIPRVGMSPVTEDSYPDVAGTIDDEKRWVRAWIDELYLWYGEVPDLDADDYADPVTYFDVLKTSGRTASGAGKDRFHFTYPTAAWEALSRRGVEPSYGVTWAVVASQPPRRVVVAYNQPGSPAAAANVGRGVEVLSVDGIDVMHGSDVAGLNAGLSPAEAGETHTFVVRDPGAAAPRTVSLTSTAVEIAPVQNVAVIETPTGRVGYLSFSDHIASAESALIDAIRQLGAGGGVSDLVLDLRYNGGGYLAIASQAAYMIAGPERTAGKTFERQVFNDKHQSSNPVTDKPLMPMPFVDVTRGFSTTPNEPLPSLGLSRVFVLTGGGTCSASEALMNGLRGIDFEVIQIGTTTCGKPYGFYPQDNCGTTYFAIQFQGVNAKGFGDYTDGLVPGSVELAGIPGCVVPDDFTHALGDPAEARLQAALAYRERGTCPPPAAYSHAAQAPLSSVDGHVVKSPWQTNRF